MNRSLVRSVGVVLVAGALAAVVVAQVNEVTWREKLDRPLEEWVDSQDEGQRTVFVHLAPELLASALREAGAYEVASHIAACQPSVVETMARIGGCAEIVFGVSLLREGSAIWERALPFCLEYGVVQVSCDIVGAGAIASMPEVERLSADLPVVVGGERPADEGSNGGAATLLGPDAL